MSDKSYFVFIASEGWEQLSHPLTKAAAVSYIKSRRFHNPREVSYCMMRKLSEEEIDTPSTKG